VQGGFEAGDVGGVGANDVRRARPPEPDPASWREQIRGVCAQFRDQYLKYPGISRGALAMAPTDLEILRVSEGMLAILLAGGVAPQAAA
jgi:hypothetical protein